MKKASETFSTFLRYLSDNYHLHEEIYQNLREEGACGWGGSSYEKRMLGWKNTLNWALPFLPVPPATVLDLGCGAGDSALPLAKLGYHMSGLDISATAIGWARDKFAQVNLRGNFQVVDLVQDEQLPWAQESFDILLDSATLHCILPPEREKVFRKILHVLKPTGFILVSSMVGDPKNLDTLEFFDPLKRLQRVKGLPLRYTPHLEDLKQELASCGLTCVQETLQENPWWDHYTALYQKLNVEKVAEGCRKGL